MQQLSYEQIKKLIDGMLVGAEDCLLTSQVVEMFEVHFKDMQYGGDHYKFKLYGYDYEAPIKEVWRAAKAANQDR